MATETECLVSTVRRPFVRSVLDVASGRHDFYTPGGRFIVRGYGFGESSPDSSENGVYVHASEISLQRVERYELWRETEIQGCWPTNLKGSVWLFVETADPGQEVHSAVHRSPIMPAIRVTEAA